MPQLSKTHPVYSEVPITQCTVGQCYKSGKCWPNVEGPQITVHTPCGAPCYFTHVENCTRNLMNQTGAHRSVDILLAFVTNIMPRVLFSNGFCF